jgi:hypothetical protein
MDGEKNDVFYIITVQTSGILRFTLTPNNQQNDYDWSLFNMTNAGCDQIYTNAVALQVSCNSYGVWLSYNGPTGINTALGNNLNCNGPGNTNGPPFNKDLTVQSGETYILNISNWSSTNQSGYTLDFSASTAAIFDNVPPVIDSIQEEILCSGASDLYFRFSENVKCADVYHHPEKFSLTGPGGPYTLTDILSDDCSTGATQSPVYHLQITPLIQAGIYTLSIIGDIHDLCDNLALYEGYDFQVVETNAPVASAGNDTSVANGSIITLHGSAQGGAGGYTYHWEPASLLIDPNVQEPVTINLGASTLFTLTVTDIAGCMGTDDVFVTVVGGPLVVLATADPQVVCQGEPSQLNAIPSGGSGNFTFQWSSVPPGFNSTLPNPTVLPDVTTTYIALLADGFSSNTDSTEVQVHPLPVADAGPDQSIPYGTSVTLHGSASGGSGNYSFYWTSNPPGYISSQQHPTFINLEENTVFYLTVTDQITECVSQSSMTVVTVTGSPLNCNPIANPMIICKGTSSQLLAMAGGGSGTYTYSWSSTPPGFNSSETNPVVSPSQTTFYHLEVNDGYNTTFGNVTLQVNPVPVIHLGPPDTNVCIYDTLLLDAGNEGSIYYWSNGATTRTMHVAATGIGYEVQTYSVKVINNSGCVDSANIRIIFSFFPCTGMNEQSPEQSGKIVPNPSQGVISVFLNTREDQVILTVRNSLGKVIRIEETTGIRNNNTLEFPIDLSFLPSGIYLIQFETKNFNGMLKCVIH